MLKSKLAFNRIRVGPASFRVLLLPPSKMGDNDAVTDFGAQELRISSNLTPRHAALVFLHETLHMIISDRLDPSGLIPDDKLGNISEEELVAHLSRGLLAVFMDNPGLRTFILKEARNFPN